MVGGVVGAATARAGRTGEAGGVVWAAGMVVVGLMNSEKNNERLGSGACEE